jgi:hypothetical protein
MKIQGWGMGLAVLLLAAGCVRAPVKPDHALKQFAWPLTRTDGTPRERGQAFLSHRVALDADMAEVGHVHLDKTALAAYFHVSGFQDLADQARGTAKTGQGLRKAAQQNLPSYWGQPGNDLLSNGLFLGGLITRNALESAAAEEDLKLEPLAVEFNRRLAKRLHLALGDAWMQPTPQRRDPLPKALVKEGDNADLDDWADDYRLSPDNSRPYDAAFFPGWAGTLQGWNAGGRPLPAAEVEDYLRAQGQPDYARSFAQGRRIGWFGSVLGDVGTLAFAASVAWWVASEYRSSSAQSMCMVSLVTGLAGWSTYAFGLNQSRTAVDGFNKSLLGAATVRADSIPKGTP